MKKAILYSALMAVCMSAAALPARKGLKKTIRLADGTTVLAELRGDEFGSCWQAEDGRLFSPDPELKSFKEISKTEFSLKAQQRRMPIEKARATRAAATRTVLAGDHQPYTGKKKGIIILAQYSDKKFKSGHDQAYYQRLANEKDFTSPYGHDGSVRDYFMEQSNGQFELDFDVFGPVTLPKPYAYYGAHTSDGANDANPGEMIATACKLANEQNDINFADYDWDGDGEVDQVFVLYAGLGEATGGDKNTIWQHESTLDGIYSYGALDFNGVKVNTYACGSEQTVSVIYNYITGTYTYKEYPDGIGTICHEFSHCLGFPDMYDTSYSGWYGTGNWDVMCSGCDNGTPFAYRPANYTAWERMYAGWQEPIVLDKPTTVKGMKPSSQYGQTFVIYNDNNKNEYYLLENRQQDGRWDSALPGSGLMITHIDFNATLWGKNIVNTPTDYSSKYGDAYKIFDNDHERCSLFQADNQSGTKYAATDLYPSNGNNQLTDTSTPSASLYNALANGATLMGKPITNITQNADGTIDFDFMGGSKSNIITGVNAVEARPNTASEGYFTTDGMFAGKDYNKLEKGVYISNGKKIIKK